MKQTIYLIRHGHTRGTTENIMYGSTDLPLIPEGYRELKKIADKGLYPTSDNSSLYTSGMLRAEQTLEAIYGDAEHRIADLLREIDFGKFEMMDVDDILQDEFGRAWLNGGISRPSFEGGDNIDDFENRIRRGLSNIIQERASKVIIITHGGVISFLMEDMFKNQKPDIWSWTPEPGSGYKIIFEDGNPLSWNEIFDDIN